MGLACPQMQTAMTCPVRRRLLAVLGAAVVPAARGAPPSDPAPRVLRLVHLHTGERLEAAYFDGGAYRPAALSSLDRLLRDFRSDEVGRIDPALLDLLHLVALRTGTRRPFEVISGFRSAATNEALRRRSGGVASASLHLLGRAVDIRLADVALERLRDAALALRAGGVGYYPGSNFVHVDTGRVRAW